MTKTYTGVTKAPLHCRFGFHPWTPWVDVAQGEVKRTDFFTNEKTVTGFFIRQERRCPTCNKVQLRFNET